MITVDPPSNAIGKTISKAIVASALTRFAARARAAAGLRGTVDVLLTDDATIRGLNRSFRGKDKATDVLSFPAIENQAKHVGDLAISLETAARQAAEHGHALQDEVRVLMLHGMLHLAGLDHERDKGEMAAREAILREQLKLPVGLIERSSEKRVRKAPAKKQAAEAPAKKAAAKKPATKKTAIKKAVAKKASAKKATNSKRRTVQR